MGKKKSRKRRANSEVSSVPSEVSVGRGLMNTVPVSFTWRHWKIQPDAVRLAFHRAAQIGDDTISEKSAILMIPVEGDQYAVTLNLPPGIYHYLFLVDGEWMQMDDQPRTHTASGRPVNYVEVLNQDEKRHRQKASYGIESLENTPLLSDVDAHGATAQGIVTEPTPAPCCACCTIL